MRGWHQARTMNLEANGARFKRNSSSVFKSENDDEKHHHELLRYSGMKIRKIETNGEKNLKDLGEIHMTDVNSFLHQTFK